jgi:(S)-mandelate dehydrogenase
MDDSGLGNAARRRVGLAHLAGRPRHDLLNVEDHRRIAKRRLPRGIFEYIDRGTEDDICLRLSASALDSINIVPRILTAAGEPRLETSYLGGTGKSPLIIGPTAAAGLAWHDGEMRLAEAAASQGVPFCVATQSVTAMERIVATGCDCWFQLYVWRDLDLTLALMERAWAAGMRNLVVTVDTPVSPVREHNVRNGFSIPYRMSRRSALDMLAHPRWLFGVMGRYLLALGGLPAFAHYPPSFRQAITGTPTSTNVQLEPNLTWDTIELLRERWQGRMILKGIMHPADAREAVHRGMDAILVSSHGGRNLDAAPAPANVLPEIVQATNRKIDVFVDGGVRRGSHILKLMSLGASAVIVGRAPLYGLAAQGSVGAARVIALLLQELKKAMAMAGLGDLQAAEGLLRHGIFNGDAKLS